MGGRQRQSMHANGPSGSGETLMRIGSRAKPHRRFAAKSLVVSIRCRAPAPSGSLWNADGMGMMRGGSEMSRSMEGF